MTQPPEFRPVTEDEQRRAGEIIAELVRLDRDAPVTVPDHLAAPSRFDGAIGLDDDGNYFPRPTPEELAHKAEVLRRDRARHDPPQD